MSINVSGTEGYDEDAQSLIERWQDVSFEIKYKSVIHLLPVRPTDVVDLGAGIGTDAAALAAMGHTVVAVEPVDALRRAGMGLHSSSRIEWVDDSLPHLTHVRSRQRTFDLIMLSAVWMHLDERERCEAMSTISSLLRDDGVIAMSLRHGPVPEGRRMFAVSAAETIQLARSRHLRTVLNIKTESAQRANQRKGVTWSWLAFAKVIGETNFDRSDQSVGGQQQPFECAHDNATQTSHDGS
ncbi:class I SAM-dependent methyltransferase [Burkholderia stagnalis]|uniref:class I SAM-dependent methyltransferase n=1 Tax=Burkholderia stagnalis TaxID=1503054 RepID=UPI0009BF9847|nr:class I SAM-dependent methyltransferase [Burkholderia stagnalis]